MSVRSLSATLALSAVLLGAGMPTASARPASYELPGDPVVSGAGGSKYEGIGYDARTQRFYVSETTGGEIHRGSLRSPAAAEWLAGDGTDGRWTARGITVDAHGRVYVAGGPNGIDHPGAPDLWVYDRSGRLLAALRTGVPNAFLNDVVIGPDGAAYFTNSNAAQVFRVAERDGRWAVRTWADASGTIPTQAGFNLGGIVVSADRRALVVAQGNVGKLWRFDLRTGAVSAVGTGGADLVNADGLVRQGDLLWVVRNFSRTLTTLRLSADGRTATLVAATPTDPDRVFTTAKLAQGRLLLVDSKFDEPVGLPPYQVVALTPPGR
ncbi:SMP-30/Gluconolaconase/LRE domain protein [Kribbella flavida DSM 17836]|uniref:SMP-30/Gluconolaconase/LRE domain protein n=1 Tax=Kribbella flavida (strain DSM 17836 / JCM 10339 / NBRC 14399) TaxID=479435 RepID=D2PUG0_KRIFD|nr:SMP-30/gluconolactonase/LRE family protein [Kribbella flavida]ADB29478.1 SMP-30/Gluconolaconase/LRE domain protein [Kribbella flavida DSM 17836]